MDTAQILADLRAQRERISQAITALEALEETAVSRPTAKAATKAAALKSGKTAPVAPPAAKKRVISPEGRKRMAAAQQKRWATKKKAAKPVAGAKLVSSKKTVAKSAKKRVVSPDSRKRMAEAQQKRWAAKKRAVKAAAKKAAAAPVGTAAVKEAPKA